MSVALYGCIKNRITIGTLISRAMFAHPVNVQSSSCVIHRITILTQELFSFIMQMLMPQYFSDGGKPLATCSTLHTSCVRSNILTHLSLSCKIKLTMLARDDLHMMVIQMMAAELMQVIN